MRNLKTVSRILSVCLIAMIVMSFVTMTVSAEVTDITSAKNGVVCVVNNSQTSQGSGFAIGKPGEPVQFIVTNNHVVEEWKGYTPDTAYVYFSAAANNFMVANVYYYNEEKDIAVLKLPEPTTMREALTLCPADAIDLSDDFAALGYPNIGSENTDYAKFDVSDIVVTRGGIKKADRINSEEVYLLDMTIENGNSGGPVVNSKGQVVGISSFGINMADVTIAPSYAIAIDELIGSIDTNTIPITVATSSNISPLLIAILAAALVLIAILIVVLVMVRKNKGGKGGEGGTQPTGATYPLVTGTTAGTAGGTAPPKTAPSPSPKQARLVAMNGYLNGKTFAVNGTSRIGRDSSKCNIAFPVNSKGISARHCEISFDGKVCTITDLGSSYGTFVNGSKLAANSPQVLKSGDKFYLAAPENMFEIRY